MSKHQADDGTCASMPANPVAVAFRQGGQVRFAPERVRETRIPRDRIGAVWSALQLYADPQFNQRATCVGADLVQFLILSGCRVGEACQLRWENVRLDDPLPTYHLPATLTKTHLRAHRTPRRPRCGQCLERRLAQRRRGEEYVFPAVRGRKAYFQDPHKLMKALTAHCWTLCTRMRCDGRPSQYCNSLDVDGDTRRTILNHAAIDVHARNTTATKEPATLMPVLEAVSDYVLATG